MPVDPPDSVSRACQPPLSSIRLIVADDHRRLRNAGSSGAFIVMKKSPWLRVAATVEHDCENSPSDVDIVMRPEKRNESTCASAWSDLEELPSPLPVRACAPERRQSSQGHGEEQDASHERDIGPAAAPLNSRTGENLGGDRRANLAQLALALDERVDDRGRTAPSTRRRSRARHRTRGPVGPVACHCVERVRNGEDARPSGSRSPPCHPGTAPVPALVMGAHDPHFALEEGDTAEHLLAQQRIESASGGPRPRSAARASGDAVRDPDLADVVEQEPVFGARVVDQPGTEGARQLERVALDALRVGAGAGVLRFERARKRRDRLLQAFWRRTLAALDLQQVPEVARVEKELLLVFDGARRDLEAAPPKARQ